MIVNSKKLKTKKIHFRANFFLKNKGYLIVRNVVNKKDFFEIRKSILKVSKKYTNSKTIYKSVEDIAFHRQLISLRKKNPKKFAFFFDTLQTTVSLINFWTNKKIISVIEKIMQCEKEYISATDMLLRIDSPVDERNKLDWHQDSSYFKQNNSGYNGLNCWAPLTKLKFEMGPLEFLENSHKLGCIKVKKIRKGKFSSLQRKIPEKITKKFKIKKYEMKLGDILFMNMDTFHRSGVNNSHFFRMTSICRYHNTKSKDFNPGLNIYRYSNKIINKRIHGF
jgi:ectoine hydroxylase-related dioxygenase (phytanoyl-CoA dioxygenase family)